MATYNMLLMIIEKKGVVFFVFFVFNKISLVNIF